MAPGISKFFVANVAQELTLERFLNWEDHMKDLGVFPCCDCGYRQKTPVTKSQKELFTRWNKSEELSLNLGKKFVILETKYDNFETRVDTLIKVSSFGCRYSAFDMAVNGFIDFSFGDSVLSIICNYCGLVLETGEEKVGIKVDGYMEPEDQHMDSENEPDEPDDGSINGEPERLQALHLRKCPWCPFASGLPSVEPI